ncbi:MAG: peptide-methionine (S)-S-oxide reductase MsrA [Gammaproteobacteria bacterium]|nr:peptide-methionine (S)-S-oxide reductase MsrA [Gammaproteobacteria bacterium]
MPKSGEYLTGRPDAMSVPAKHFVLGSKMSPPYPDGLELAMFGMGCFWGAERAFWKLNGVYVTAVGYASGLTPDPLYEEVCSGLTGHNEVVRIVYDPQQLSYQALLSVFWQSHDPTQGMRQGNDVGTQYRSGIYFYSEQQKNLARQSLSQYQTALMMAGFGQITTELLPAPEFYFAEDYHQQYLAKNPQGYCGLGGTGVECF